MLYFKKTKLLAIPKLSYCLFMLHLNMKWEDRVILGKHEMDLNIPGMVVISTRNSVFLRFNKISKQHAGQLDFISHEKLTLEYFRSVRKRVE